MEGRDTAGGEEWRGGILHAYLHKLMGIYMVDLILGVVLQYMVSASFSCFSQVAKS